MWQAEKIIAKQTSFAARRSDADRAGAASCVVLSGSADRGERLREAAAAVDWETCIANEPLQARRRVIEQRSRLLVVDLPGEADRAAPAVKKLVEQVARRRDVLVMLCGGEGNPAEEAWARRLGVWLYLPGVSDESEISHWIGAAAEAVARKHPS